MPLVNQGYTGKQPAVYAEVHGIRLEVVKLPSAALLLPRRRMVERSSVRMARFRRQRGGPVFDDQMALFPVDKNTHGPKDPEKEVLSDSNRPS